MTDSQITPNQDMQNELEVLKARADQLKIQYHPSIGLDKLREKVNEALKDKPDPQPKSIDPVAKKEAAKLIRVRIACMNPLKKDWEGEIFDVGNSVVGSFKKFVPFNVEWHIPQLMFNFIKERKFQTFYTEKVNGQEVRRGKQVAEFSIEVLPPLTEKELKELAQRQAMAAGKE